MRICFCDQFFKTLQFYVINPNLGQKGSKLVLHVPMTIERWKSIVKGDLRWSISFWKHYLKILNFWLLVVMSSTPKWVKKFQVAISCTNVFRKMRLKSKRYFQVNYSSMKPFSKKIEVLTQRRDVINPKSARKRVQTGISCTNSDRKIKIKTKRNFEMRYSFMKLFSGNFKILAPCCEVIISKSGQKDSSLYIMYNWLKNIPEKSRKIRNIPSKSLYRSGFNPSTVNCILHISLVSFWHYLNFSITFRTRYAQIQYDPISAIMTSERRLKFQSL